MSTYNAGEQDWGLSLSTTPLRTACRTSFLVCLLEQVVSFCPPLEKKSDSNTQIDLHTLRSYRSQKQNPYQEFTSRRLSPVDSSAQTLQIELPYPKEKRIRHRLYPSARELSSRTPGNATECAFNRMRFFIVRLRPRGVGGGVRRSS